MTAKFWFDSYYAEFTNTPIPVRFKTLYSESFISNVLMVLFGGFGVWICSYFFYAFVFVASDMNAAVKTTGTVITCSYTPPKGKINANMDFVLEYQRMDGATTQGRDSVIGDYMNWRSCDEFPAGTRLQIGYRTDENRVYIMDSRLERPWYNALVMYGAFLGTGALMVIFVLAGLNGIRKFVVKRREVVMLTNRGELRDGVIALSKGMLVGKYNQFFDLEITYDFFTPEGEKVSRKQKARRNDLKDHPLPETGTPVTILYVDKKVNCML